MTMDTSQRKAALDRLLGYAARATGKRSYLYQRSPTHKHRGVDIGAPRDTPIGAFFDGVVTHASNELAEGFSGYGRHVVVKVDGGPWLLFGHLERVDVEPGDTVEFGEQLGTVGDSCFDRSDPAKACKGTHIHFEVSPTHYPQPSEAERLDPIAWLESQRAALDVAGPVKVAKKKKKKKRKHARLAETGLGIGLGVAVSFVFMLVIISRANQ